MSNENDDENVWQEVQRLLLEELLRRTMSTAEQDLEGEEDGEKMRSTQEMGE